MTSAHELEPTTRRLANGLGWCSIALGLAELVAARPMARALGMEDRTELLRAYGVRELVTGIGILTQDDPGPWLWGRVGGDVLDLATLAMARDTENPHRKTVDMALATVAGITALDVICAQAVGREMTRPAAPMRDYADRVGMARPPAQMRGAADEFEPPRDFRIPEPLRPYAV